MFFTRHGRLGLILIWFVLVVRTVNPRRNGPDVLHPLLVCQAAGWNETACVLTVPLLGFWQGHLFHRSDRSVLLALGGVMLLNLIRVALEIFKAHDLCPRLKATAPRGAPHTTDPVNAARRTEVPWEPPYPACPPDRAAHPGLFQKATAAPRGRRTARSSLPDSRA